MNRQLEIIYLLLSREQLSAKELAERFGVSTRTIYRDIDAISAAGIPIYTDKGNSSGIKLLPGFVLNKAILSEREQDEILSALHLLSSLQNGSVGSTLRKLSAVFNKAALDWLEVNLSDSSFLDTHIFSGIKTAIYERRVVMFDYYSTSDKTHRHVSPIKLQFNGKSWYLQAFCHTRQDVRSFKLTRMREFIVTNKTFEERETPVGSEYVEQNTTTLRLKIASEMAHRVFDEFDFHSAELQPDGSYVVEVTWSKNDWMYGKILSFGIYAEVLEPEHIKAIVKDKAKGIFDKY